ncbi:hypothetical protein C0J52_07741 [Blattella germanica]|nr:hypothetical protein C0J52_07741 [Blattella germanica]
MFVVLKYFTYFHRVDLYFRVICVFTDDDDGPESRQLYKLSMFECIAFGWLLLVWLV